MCLVVPALSFGGEYTHTFQKNKFSNKEGILSDTDNKVQEYSASAFAEYKLTFGKLNVGAGVRYEHNTSDYYENGKLVDEQSKVYDNLYPTASLSYPIGPVSTNLSHRADEGTTEYIAQHLSELQQNRQDDLLAGCIAYDRMLEP